LISLKLAYEAMNFILLTFALGIFPLTTFASGAHSEQIAAVDTAFKLLGPDHKIVIEVFDDPRVQGVSCYIARAKTGGIKGAVGLAEDKAEASVSCRQVGDITFSGPIPKKENIFDERISLLFKKIRVVRVADPARNTLVYLVYSDRLIDGSPQNSITAVPVPRTTLIPVK
jgi:CreA protein